MEPKLYTGISEAGLLCEPIPVDVRGVRSALQAAHDASADLWISTQDGPRMLLDRDTIEEWYSLGASDKVHERDIEYAVYCEARRLGLTLRLRWLEAEA